MKIVRTGEKFGFEYLSSVFFLNGPYFCSNAALGSTSGGGTELTPRIVGGTLWSRVGADMANSDAAWEGVPIAETGGNGNDDPAGTNVGGGRLERGTPPRKGGPGGSIPGGMAPSGGIVPGGGIGKPGGNGL